MNKHKVCILFSFSCQFAGMLLFVWLISAIVQYCAVVCVCTCDVMPFYVVNFRCTILNVFNCMVNHDDKFYCRFDAAQFSVLDIFMSFDIYLFDRGFL